MAYGLQPTQFITAFRSVSRAIRAVTNSTYLVFAPNIASGSVDGLQGYSQYDPGAEYYDLGASMGSLAALSPIRRHQLLLCRREQRAEHGARRRHVLGRLAKLLRRASWLDEVSTDGADVRQQGADHHY